MPLPFLVAGIAVAAGAIGAGGHLSAKKTNEEAQQISADAKRMYDNAKLSLETSKQKTEEALLALGKRKKKVLSTSVNQFTQVYNKIKKIELKESAGVSELSKFEISPEDALQLQKMADIYESNLSGAAAGAAAGTLIALASSGSLPLMAGLLSTAGSAVAIGELGMAASLASSAASLSLAATPLSVIAAPVMLFTGIQSSIKADENLEKANVMYSEAKAAVEKMKVSETMCNAIAKRARMYDNLLAELNNMFSESTSMLNGVIKKKEGIFKSKKLTSRNFDKYEIQLMAVTRSLAGAVKAVIDTPILSESGEVTENSKEVYDSTRTEIVKFKKEISEIKENNKKIKPVAVKTKNKAIETQDKPEKIEFSESVVNIIAIVAAFVISGFFVGIEKWSIFSVAIMLFMKKDTESEIFKCIKNINYVAFAIESAVLLYRQSILIAMGEHSFIMDIIYGVIAFIVLIYAITTLDVHSGNFKLLILRLSSCLFFFSIASLIFAILANLIGINFGFSIVVTEILFIPFAFISAFLHVV